MGVIGGAETACSSKALKFSPVGIVQYLVLFVVFCWPMFCRFSLGYCTVCSSVYDGLNYPFDIFNLFSSDGPKFSNSIFRRRNPKIIQSEDICIEYNDLIGLFSSFITVSRIDEMS